MCRYSCSIILSALCPEFHHLRLEKNYFPCHNLPMLKNCQKHLHAVHESYFQHLHFAGFFGLRLIGAGFAAILHGICPAVFQYTGSKTLFALCDEIKARQKGQSPNGSHHHE